MKKFLACIFAGIFFFMQAVGQSEIDDVAKALQAGEVAYIARHLDNLVEISIANEQSTYSKTQAERVLDNFFTKNKVKEFSMRHQGGNTSDNAIFVIGDLSTAQGNYRVYLMFKKKKDDSFTLQELRFE